MSDTSNQDLGWANPRPWTVQIENGRAVIRDRTGTQVFTGVLGYEEAVTICRAANLHEEFVSLLQIALSTGAPDQIDKVHPGWYRRAIETYAKAMGMEQQP